MNDELEPLPGMIGRDPAMLSVYRFARLAACSDAPVLIVGESGTGKELVAQAIHGLSSRGRRRLVPLNCAALPESLVEVELFGVEAGTFTDARRTRDGLLAEADGTTLLLDELCSMSLASQAKLLRVLQFGEFRRVGGRQSLESHTRVIATVSEHPAQLVRRRRLRVDLLYRLAVLTIHLPALRDRPGDIVPLAQALLRTAPGGGTRDLANSTHPILEDYDWPGNVRELQSVMWRAAVNATGPSIVGEDLVPFLAASSGNGARTAGSSNGSPSASATRDGDRGLRWNREQLSALIGAHAGYVASAARTAGVPRSTLQRWLAEVGLSGGGARGRPTAGAENNAQWAF